LIDSLASLDPRTVQFLAIGSLMLGYALTEGARGHLRPSAAGREDDRLDIAVTLSFPVVSGLVLAASDALCATIWPSSRGALAHWPVWLMVLTLLLADDLTQYLWHRLSHTRVLWPLHRAHHSAAYMSMRVVYRNNLFYYAMMPGLWLSGALLFLGFGWVYVGYTIVKLAVIIGAHSPLRWDAPLYRHRALEPLAWLIERTISTPATHFAHHALHEDDGIGHHNGNYGNLLFLWDVLFGTARITRQLPPAYGLVDDRRWGSESWTVQWLYPLRQSTRESSDLGPAGRRAGN
jgi:sterol desaturase/sphingolipid hydroxylase (fatty acid hydroxylase superfamily)